MEKTRFSRFTDDELYILKRAMIEATKYIYSQEDISYNEMELDTLDRLLEEAIDNIKAREIIENNVSRFEQAVR